MLDDRHGVGGRHADRLVEHDPAMHVALYFFLWRARIAAGLLGKSAFPLNKRAGEGGEGLSHQSSFRSRATAGVRRSFSIRSASSKRSSMRKRMSGANFRLIRREISPRI